MFALSAATASKGPSLAYSCYFLLVPQQQQREKQSLVLWRQTQKCRSFANWDDFQILWCKAGRSADSILHSHTDDVCKMAENF
jgi:hypothetical protein